MIFHTFTSQEERRKYYGSCFIEIQYCKLPPGTGIKKIVNEVQHWKNDSLYIPSNEDHDEFWKWYKDIFTGGTYQNLKKGVMDLYCINYYSGRQVQHRMEKLKAQQPPDYQVLLNWLEAGTQYNGIYILGI